VFLLFLLHVVYGQIKVMPLGDSITFGCFDGCYGNISAYSCPSPASPPPWTCQGGYRAQLAAVWSSTGVDFTFVGPFSSGTGFPANHAGWPGFTVALLNAYVAGWIDTYQPDYILIHAGTNDAMGSEPLGTYANNLMNLLITIYGASSSVRVFVSTLIPVFCPATVNNYILAYNSIIPSVVSDAYNAGHQIAAVDMYNGAGLTQSMYGDGCVHPNTFGYILMGNYWAKAAPITGVERFPSPFFTFNTSVKGN